eukprot:TRINITY_DN3446_c0_g2_i8.p1 TRINITY_DN3446_c0_g2~~TRINITY_DN3446_c0_g2_i8.p1  ORF type:complete len:445 (+),score=87.98 TRINITY_DN3446_c0_g2_i8:39-1373(+)
MGELESFDPTNMNTIDPFSNSQGFEGVPEKKSSAMENSQLLSWGKNKEGELSHGGTKNANVPTYVRGLRNKEIKTLSAGGQHSAVVTVTGELFICGSALHGKLGIEDLMMTNITRFQPVPALKGMIVREVACGDYHTLCLLETGVVFAWGGTLHKKTGQKGGKPGPIRGFENKKVVHIGCGDFFSAALTDKGELYTWGGGGYHFNKGQLGHGHLNDIETPEMVKFFKEKKVAKFSCGGYHMMALTVDNELYGWGSGMYGEGGFGEFADSTHPRKVKINFNAKAIAQFCERPDLREDQLQKIRFADFACGGHHSLILSTTGHVYSCGYASHGQLGLKNTTNHCEPQLIASLINKKVIQIAAGWNHSLVLTSTLDAYACGYGLFGQLGVGDEESKTTFTHVSSLAGKRVNRIFAGGNHSWVMLDYNNTDIENYVLPSPLRLSLIHI